MSLVPPDFSHVTRCLDVTDSDVALAVESRTACLRLLQRMAEIAAPKSGAPKVLLVLAKLAGPTCGWIDGALRVEIFGDEQVTVVEILSELTDDLRERVFPPIALKAPVSELRGSLERLPHVVAPLVRLSDAGKRIVLAMPRPGDDD